MIKINDKEYKRDDYRVLVGNFDIFKCGERKQGESPTIDFCCEGEENYVRIETVYDMKLIKELEIGKETDITSYVSDIDYQDKDGWVSLIPGPHKCSLTRVDEESYRVILSSYFEDFDINIELDEIIKL